MPKAVSENLLPRSSAVCLIIAAIAAVVGTQLNGEVSEEAPSPSLIVPAGSWAAQASWSAGKKELSLYHASSRDFGDPTSTGEVTIAVQRVLLSSKKQPHQGEEGLEQEIQERYRNASARSDKNTRETVLRAKPEQLLRSRSVFIGRGSSFSSFELQFSRIGKAWGFEDSIGSWQAASSGYSLTPTSLILALRQNPVEQERPLSIFFALPINHRMVSSHPGSISKVGQSQVKLSNENIDCHEYIEKARGEVFDRIWIEKAKPRRLLKRRSGDGLYWLLKKHEWR